MNVDDPGTSQYCPNCEALAKRLKEAEGLLRQCSHSVFMAAYEEQRLGSASYYGNRPMTALSKELEAFLTPTPKTELGEMVMVRREDLEGIITQINKQLVRTFDPFIKKSSINEPFIVALDRLKAALENP